MRFVCTQRGAADVQRATRNEGRATRNMRAFNVEHAAHGASRWMDGRAKGLRERATDCTTACADGAVSARVRLARP